MSLALAAFAWKRRESDNTYCDEEEDVDYLIDKSFTFLNIVVLILFA